MTTSQAVQLFESTRVRSYGDAAQKKWHFSVVDLVQVLTVLILLRLIQSIPSPKADPFPEVRLAAAS
jgi:hypothetical protein